ncbi:MAG: flagellar basal body-associated FliL family protein [Deltaproteobacteria bacterium]|nr:flagellar basal body-associated FliL family protein [Deltaproteobacteria bacterium]
MKRNAPNGRKTALPRRLFDLAAALAFIFCAAGASAESGGPSYYGDISSAPLFAGEIKGEPTADDREPGLAAHFEFFRDFIVLMRQADNIYRMIYFDCALEVCDEISLSDDCLAVRSAIYESAKKDGREARDLVGVKEALRKDIRAAINRFFRGSVVKNVYFDKFVVF